MAKNSKKAGTKSVKADKPALKSKKQPDNGTNPTITDTLEEEVAQPEAPVTAEPSAEDKARTEAEQNARAYFDNRQRNRSRIK